MYVRDGKGSLGSVARVPSVGSESAHLHLSQTGRAIWSDPFEKDIPRFIVKLETFEVYQK